jgi:uncharacterized membrane protein YphA (DoxX/SURF4 family)
MNKVFSWLLNPPIDGPKTTLLLRFMAGGVFFWEGILKFVYVNQGVGRFTKLGIPFPHYTATFIGCLEIVGGMLLLSGLLTRLIAIPFVAEMIVAIFLDEDFALSGNIAVAAAARASADRDLGGVTRNPIRLRADSNSYFSVGERSRKMVAGCGVAAQIHESRCCRPRPDGQDLRSAACRWSLSLRSKTGEIASNERDGRAAIYTVGLWVMALAIPGLSKRWRCRYSRVCTTSRIG